MRFAGRLVVAVGDDWIDVEQPDSSVARLVGYNEALIEVEAGETAPAVARTNESTIRDRAEQALAANLAFRESTIPATVAARLTRLEQEAERASRQRTALIRLVLNRFDGTD